MTVSRKGFIMFCLTSFVLSYFLSFTPRSWWEIPWKLHLLDGISLIRAYAYDQNIRLFGKILIHAQLLYMWSNCEYLPKRLTCGYCGIRFIFRICLYVILYCTLTAIKSLNRTINGYRGQLLLNGSFYLGIFKKTSIDWSINENLTKLKFLVIYRFLNTGWDAKIHPSVIWFFPVCSTDFGGHFQIYHVSAPSFSRTIAYILIALYFTITCWAMFSPANIHSCFLLLI